MIKIVATDPKEYIIVDALNNVVELPDITYEGKDYIKIVHNNLPSKKLRDVFNDTILIKEDCVINISHNSLFQIERALAARSITINNKKKNIETDTERVSACYQTLFNFVQNKVIDKVIFIDKERDNDFKAIASISYIPDIGATYIPLAPEQYIHEGGLMRLYVSKLDMIKSSLYVYCTEN